MSVLGNFIKQPAEVETYSIDYSDDLTENDAVASAVTAVAPVGLTVDYTQAIPLEARVRVKLSGGTVGTKYKVTITTTTDDGRVLQDEFIVRIKEL